MVLSNFTRPVSRARSGFRAETPGASGMAGVWFMSHRWRIEEGLASHDLLALELIDIAEADIEVLAAPVLASEGADRADRVAVLGRADQLDHVPARLDDPAALVEVQQVRQAADGVVAWPDVPHILMEEMWQHVPL